MPNAYSENRGFQSAAARRRGERVTFHLDTWVYDDPDDENDAGREHRVVFMVDPMVDLLRLGAAFGDIGTTLGALSADTTSAQEKLHLLDTELPKLRASVRDLLIPKSRTDWDQWGHEFDAQMMASLVRMLMKELSPLDPTQPESSPGGSSTTSTPSTDGAPPAESTLTLSPSDAA
jgi:hypothetical protein